MIDPAEIAARPQVPADRPRRLLARASPPATRSRSPPHGPNRSTSTSSSTCSTSRPARRSSATWPASATPSPAAARRSTKPSAPCAGWPKTASRRCARSSHPSTDFGGFWRALEALSATVAPVAETQASMFVALDRTFAAFARVSRPYIQETIAKGPPTLDAVDRRPAGAAALPPQLRPLLHRPAARAPRRSPKPRRRSPPRCAPASRRSTPRRSSTPSCTPTAEALVAFQDAPGVFNGLDLLIDTNELLEPGDPLHRPGPDHLQLPHARLPQPGQRRQRGQRHGQLAQRPSLRAAGRPEHRGQARRRRPANGPGRSPQTTSTPTPTRTPRRPARPRTAKRATSATCRGRP